MLNDPDADVRELAMRQLASFDAKTLMPHATVIKAKIDDSSHGVRRHADVALERLGSDRTSTHAPVR